MRYSDTSYNLRIELDTEHCHLSPAQMRKLESGLSPLRQVLRDFPVSDLYIDVEHYPGSEEYRVKLALQLPGKGLASGDVHEDLYTAFRHSVRRLVDSATAYKERLGRVDTISKAQQGTHHELLPTHSLDADALDAAVADQDYVAFRRETFPIEEPLRKRIGRWIQRYPEIEAQIGERFDLSDMVEEVFLSAFDQYRDWPRDIPFGAWLESLIDPSVRLLSRKSEAQMANISFVKSLLDAHTTIEASP